ncbi:MAG TPA: LON peptidase substrate-binding domain-containing protein [Thermoanaerobaculia bacterium]|nr:LON peptidase substrate-binding domain-containing protein [Thermoanaerobaculia bacterium]
MTTTRSIPIFALPGVVLLPGTLLPLHIFEARYRAMVADALQGDKIIGMALMRPGWEAGGRDPEIFPVGGAGEIVDTERLEDGRYNILLKGQFRYRILHEAAVDPYRKASVEEIASLPFRDRTSQDRARRRVTRLFEQLREEMDLPPLPEEDLSPERLASEIALRLRYAPAELQAMLEIDSVPARVEQLVDRLGEWRRRLLFLAPFRPAELDAGRN